MQGVPQLPEEVVEVTDSSKGDYGGDWGRLKEEVKGVNRTEKDWRVATTRVHVVVSDRSVRNIGMRV